MKLVLKKINPFLGRQSGASLVDVIMTVGIAAIVTLTAQSLLIRTDANSRNLKYKADAAQIRNSIVRNLDCAATLAAMAGVCNEGGYIQLLSRMSSKPVLIGKPVSGGHDTLTFDKIGVYSLGATCEKCASGCPKGHKIMVKYAVIDGSNPSQKNPQFVKDPMTGKLMDWSSGVDLFEGIPIACEVPF